MTIVRRAAFRDVERVRAAVLILHSVRPLIVSAGVPLAKVLGPGGFEIRLLSSGLESIAHGVGLGKQGWGVIFYNFSGGMESAAMLALERDRIVAENASVRFADTGKQFPEMADSIREIERKLCIRIYIVPSRITFDEFLFEKGGMIRKGTTDCSRRMKRANLMAHMKTFAPPYEVNLGFNSGEMDRADAFTDRNEREWLHWRFPLIERDVSRAETVEICEAHGFEILLAMYKKMGRFDCFWCGNQSPAQALLVAQHYPALANEWMAAEARKGHSFMPVALKVLIQREEETFPLFRKGECACFGGDDDFVTDDEFQKQGG